MKARALLKPLQDEIAHWPGVDLQSVRKRKHPVLQLNFNNNSRQIVMGGTTSDHRSMLNNIARIRRVCRELGAERHDN